MNLSRSSLSSSLLLSALAVACGGSQGGKKTDSAEGPKVVDQDDSAPSDHRAFAPDIDDDEDGDENLQIEGLKGHLDPYDIQLGVEPKNAALAACFETRAKREKYLGGDVELSYTVARDGSVKTVRVSKSDVGSWEVEACLLEVSKSMHFKKPKGGEADFSLPLEFQARRKALWWTEEKANEELADKPGELDGCAKESGAPEPSNVWVTFYLGNRGVVQSVGFASPNERGIDPAWANCAVAKASAWVLSDPRGKVVKLGFRYNPE